MHQRRRTPMEDVVDMEECHLTLHNEFNDLVQGSTVSVIQEPPSALNFLRNWVMPNKPVLINHAIDGWNALTKWTNAYLRDEVGSLAVTMAVTDDGWADSAVFKNQQYQFRLPDEHRLPLNQLLDNLERVQDKLPMPEVNAVSEEINLPPVHPRVCDYDPENIMDAGIWYIQKQDSNLLREFISLLPDVSVDIPWATEALNRAPDAVNLWLGDGRAVSSMHRDHYENLYCVVRGEKLFTLLPPTDIPHVQYRTCDVYQHKFSLDTGQFSLISQNKKIEWIYGAARPPARPIHVRVTAGQMLYLPALWFHQVQQTHGCIAVNYWYDMDFDLRFCYYKFLESTCQLRADYKDRNLPPVDLIKAPRE